MGRASETQSQKEEGNDKDAEKTKQARKARGESTKPETGFFEKVGNVGKTLARVMEKKEGRRSN